MSPYVTTATFVSTTEKTIVSLEELASTTHLSADAIDEIIHTQNETLAILTKIIQVQSQTLTIIKSIALFSLLAFILSFNKTLIKNIFLWLLGWIGRTSIAMKGKSDWDKLTTLGPALIGILATIWAMITFLLPFIRQAYSILVSG